MISILQPGGWWSHEYGIFPGSSICAVDSRSTCNRDGWLFECQPDDQSFVRRVRFTARVPQAFSVVPPGTVVGECVAVLTPGNDLTTSVSLRASRFPSVRRIFVPDVAYVPVPCLLCDGVVGPFEFDTHFGSGHDEYNRPAYRRLLVAQLRLAQRAAAASARRAYPYPSIRDELWRRASLLQDSLGGVVLAGAGVTTRRWRPIDHHQLLARVLY